MNEKLYRQLKIFQTLLSLIRDLVLILIIIFTVVIVYFGGEPTKLNALDWAKLIGSAFMIVLAPLIIFVVFRTGFKIFNDVDFMIIFAFLQLKILHYKKQIKKQDISLMLKNKETSNEFLLKYPEKAKTITNLLKQIKRSQILASKTAPYFYALIILSIVIFMFIKIFSKYIP